VLNIKDETHRDVVRKPNGGAPVSVAQRLSGAMSKLRSSGPRSSSGLPALLPKRDTPSVIASDLTILGDIVCEDGAVTILGRVRGELRIADLTVGHGAQVAGNIYALTLNVEGDVSGTIHANHVKLARSATVKGDIYHQTLSIEEHGLFEGMSQRMENAMGTVQMKNPHQQVSKSETASGASSASTQ
jgi:cytoskeletal protein CcmA (bactofilin family)